MRVKTRSPRTTRAISAVWNRIPSAERSRIDEFLTHIRLMRGWQVQGGMNLALSATGGELVPLVQLGKPGPMRAQIVLYEPVCRLFSPIALKGIIAHELAHASRAAAIGPDGYKYIVANYQREERKADALAVAWGFGAEITRRRDVERPRVNQTIRNRERSIQRRLDRKP